MITNYCTRGIQLKREKKIMEMKMIFISKTASIQIVFEFLQEPARGDHFSEFWNCQDK